MATLAIFKKMRGRRPKLMIKTTKTGQKEGERAIILAKKGERMYRRE